MPFYEVQHTYPLTLPQKHAFAKAITELHSTTFLTPSLFVNVSFHLLQPRNEENVYFLAGEPVAHNNAGPNRVLAMVRTGPKRTKATWDDLAAKLEERWYDIVNDEKQ
ncbi:putative cis-3-chloroacrylic acid dehalogenase [Cladophialophora carrionii]|uniref:Putative cis-3-chloroacrylic acid dehalogenase n=1 Tax=Cladophialophora carrionii TaxID=86049 RepID=A0A1C1CJW2_9EURO|nr:putative cis-3-chloroacrylic acid dehalogenase [Cladophialophora carrionii]